MLKNKVYKFLFYAFLIVVLTFMIIKPKVCAAGVSRGLLVCTNVIIPSLFPFMVCVLLLMKKQIHTNNKILSKILYLVFGHNFDMFITFLFSTLGGYPVGCKLINELYVQKKINLKTANIMQCYCVNAGPAFVITAVGVGIFSSKKIGIILFLSHISASLIMAIFAAKYTRKNFKETQTIKSHKNTFAENFVLSTADAAASIIGICSFIILFSAINSYLEYFSNRVPILEIITYFTEVTIGTTKCKNIVFASFLLGFSGVSIWCQILSTSKNAKINFKLFVMGRFLHATLSSVITFFILKYVNLPINTISNKKLINIDIFYTNFSLAISLAIMIMVLLIYFFSKNCSRKLLDDMI